MEQVCHRCDDTLVSNELYCPRCGAPQLRVEESEPILTTQEGSLQQSLDQAAEMMRWRSAVIAALLVAVPTALFCAVLHFVALWGIIGGLFVVSVYRRRTVSLATAQTDGHIGWRIGGLMGVIAAILWLAIESFSMLFERYVMHHQPRIIAVIQDALHASIAAMSQQNPAFAHQYPWFAKLLLSPTGIATFYVSEISFIAISMVFFSSLGGAVGGRYLRSRAPRAGAF